VPRRVASGRRRRSPSWLPTVGRHRRHSSQALHPPHLREGRRPDRRRHRYRAGRRSRRGDGAPLAGRDAPGWSGRLDVPERPHPVASGSSSRRGAWPPRLEPGLVGVGAEADRRRTPRPPVPDREEVRRLLAVCDGSRTFDAAVAMLFTSGNRASEVLGLAWSDVDLDAGTATVRRACTYTGGGIGPRLDKPKTASTSGVHHLAPTVVVLLRRHHVAQAADRLAAGPAWETITYEGQPVDLVFTTAAGSLPLRQALYKAVVEACERAGIDPAGIGTHTGRRSTVTALYVAGLPLDDVARHAWRWRCRGGRPHRRGSARGTRRGRVGWCGPGRGVRGACRGACRASLGVAGSAVRG